MSPIINGRLKETGVPLLRINGIPIRIQAAITKNICLYRQFSRQIAMGTLRRNPFIFFSLAIPSTPPKVSILYDFIFILPCFIRIHEFA